MKSRTVVSGFLLLSLIVATCLPADARPHHRDHGYWRGPGIYLAPMPFPLPPFPVPYTHTYRYYDDPPPVVIREEPEVYIQQEQPVERYWYYCPSTKGYYPYTTNCPEGWMKVLPKPSN